jgi:nicotinamide-nucleotide amidase
MVYGYPESALAIKIADWENALPEYIKLAYLPHMGIIKLRLSAILDDILTLNFAVNQQIDALSEVLGDAIISYEDLTLEQIIGQMLTEKNKTLATAESCTGGYIASKITLVPGSSNYYNGSMVAYSNEIKTKVLKVPADLIEKHGAVSAEVVEAMATGVRQLMHTDYAIATSGIAGPGGGTDDKPIGTVWVAVACDNQIVSRKFHFFGARTQVIERTALEAFLILRGIIAS